MKTTILVSATLIAQAIRPEMFQQVGLNFFVALCIIFAFCADLYGSAK